MPNNKTNSAAEVMNSLPSEAKLRFQKLLHEYDIPEDDPMVLGLALMKSETVTLERLDELLTQKEQSLQALLVRIEAATTLLCKKADEFTVETNKLRSELEVSANIAKHVVFHDRQDKLRGSQSLAPQTRIKAFPLILVAAGIASIFGLLLVAVLLLALVR